MHCISNSKQWNVFPKRENYFNRKEGKRMTYQEIFQKFKQQFQNANVSSIQGRLAYQFNITGEGAGAFYAEVKDGVLSIEPYEYHDRDVLFTCKADTLFNIISGKTDPVVAFTLGKLKVEGSLEKALLLKNMI